MNLLTLQEVIETRDVALIKDYYLKNNDVEYLDMIELIIKTEDTEFIKQCVEDTELVDTNFERIELIVATKDIKYIKKCLKDSKFEFDLYDQMNIIRNTENKDFIKECLENSDFNWDWKRKITLLKATQDIRYIKESLEKDTFDLGENKYLAEEQLSYIIATMDKPDEIKKIIEDKEIITDKKLVKNEATLVTLILRTKDKEYIKECINNQELSLSEASKSGILLILDEGREAIEEGFDNVGYKKFNLPENMTVGMEIESVGNSSSIIIEGFSYRDWKSKFEFDLMDEGCEVISPPMKSSQEYSSEIYNVNNLLIKLGQSISEKCGGHIHIGSDYLKSKQAYENLEDIYCATEKALYVVCNEKGTIPRKGIFENAVMISDDIQRIIENKSFDIGDETQLNNFIKTWKQSQIEIAGRKRAFDGRSTGLNMLNVNNMKNTIEFRFPNGTLNPDMWIENINLLGGIVAISQELSEIQERDVKTKEEMHKLEIFESLKKSKIGKEKLALLLELTGLEIEEYIDRYNTNIELIKKDAEMAQLFIEEPTIEVDEIAIVAGQSSAIQQQKVETEIIKAYEKSEKSKTAAINR